MHVSGAYITDDTLNKRVTLTITSTFDPTLVWVGDAAGIWDVGNPNNKVWKVAGSGATAYYTDGSWVRFDDTATGTTTINVSTTVSPARTTINNSGKDYTFVGSGNISGTGLLIKRGSGKLTINTVGNNWSGGTLIEAGTIQIGDGSTGATISGTVPITNNGTLTFNSTAEHTITAVIRGTGRVVQQGSGALILNAANEHTGGVEVRAGAILNLNNAGGTAAGAPGAPIILNGGVLQLGQNVGGGYTGIVASTSIIQNGADRRFRSPIVGTNQTLIISNTALFTFSADIQGFSGRIVLATPNSSSVRFNEGGDNPCTGSRSAMFVFSPGAGSTSWLISRNAGVMELGGIEGGPGRIDQQSSAGGANYVTYSIGWLGSNSVWTGIISDAARTTAVAKVGLGTLTLTNVELIHKGLLSVSNGVLAFAGTTANSRTNEGYIVVAPGVLDLTNASDPNLRVGVSTVVQRLEGNGTIRGNVILGSNARLRPGLPVGALTVEGSIALAGVTTMAIDRSASPNSARLVANTITGGGVLIVTNIGPTDFAAGDTFTLFNKPVSGFSSITWALPALTPPLYWTNMLAIDGTIRVLSTAPPVPTTPTNITLTRISATQLMVEWPSNYIGWRLETNAVSVVATNQWFTWVNSTTTNRVIINIDQTKTNVYFRLVYP
ncbi:MAG: autotransporter-associated beta strand repeat-containing protein [Verrucomicrobiales bacterium]|nr:autotransporter-associated beta strand repeat-containing protein [Verrucomicrobiales bacterium]